MSETKHSPEPWRVTRDDDVSGPYGFDVRDDRGGMILWHTTEANARRIVACANACEGIPTEALESGALGEVLRMADEVAYSVDDPMGGRTSELAELLRRLGRLP